MQRLMTLVAFLSAILGSTSGGPVKTGQLSANRHPTNLAAAPSAVRSPHAVLVKSYGRLPLTFEPNRGQADDSVKFVSRGAGYALLLKSTEAVLQLRHSAPRQALTPRARHDRFREAPGTISTISLRMLGANSDATVSGAEPFLTRSNYFLGNDPTKWRTDVPTYGKVRYENVYPDMDLVFYGNQRALEYDLVVRPGGDPRVIQLAFDGANHLELDANGDLLVRAAGTGDIVRQRKPLVYQVVGGRREPIEAGYGIDREKHVKLWTAAYDARTPLVIDPVLDYATYLGGSADDSADGIAVDSAGNTYIVGSTSSADFPTKNPLQPAIGAGSAVFVAKLSADGSSLLYATYLGGGSEKTWPTGIAVDRAGSAYVTGGTTSSNFPITPGAFQVAFGGGPCASGSSTYTCDDGFIAKLNATGNGLAYSTYLGATKNDDAHAIAVDAAGNAYVTGHTNSADFPVTRGAFQTSVTFSDQCDGGCTHAFVAKLTADGTSLAYATYLAGDDYDEGDGIAVDDRGSAYVAGAPSYRNFPTTPNAFQTKSCYTFVAKLPPDGSALVYSTRLGGTSSPLLGPFDTGELEGVSAIAIDGQGNAYVTGFTLFTDFPTTPGAVFSSAPCGGANGKGGHGTFWSDGFVSKVNADGTALVYSTYLGGCRGEGGNAIAVDSARNAYVAGNTNSTDFPMAGEPLQDMLADGKCGAFVCDDAFLVKLSPAGDELLYSTYLGGATFDSAAAVAVDATGNVYIAGRAGAGFPTTGRAYQPLIAGGTDAFVAKVRFR